jgi:hypothetical protein
MITNDCRTTITKVAGDQVVISIVQ